MNQLNDIENNINSLIINEHIEHNKDKINLSNNTYVENFLYMKDCYIDNMLNFLYYSIYNIYYRYKPECKCRFIAIF